MRLPLDTHVLLWWLADDPALGSQVEESIDTEDEVFFSAAARTMRPRRAAYRRCTTTRSIGCSWRRPAASS
ncbi:hypothetical protein SKPI104516_08950 [Skermania piniformis]